MIAVGCGGWGVSTYVCLATTDLTLTRTPGDGREIGRAVGGGDAVCSTCRSKGACTVATEVLVGGSSPPSSSSFPFFPPFPRRYLIGLGTSYSSVMVLFALNGVALSSVIPPSAALLADAAAPSQRSKVYGAQMAVTAAAGLVASVAVSVISAAASVE